MVDSVGVIVVTGSSSGLNVNAFEFAAVQEKISAPVEIIWIESPKQTKAVSSSIFTNSNSTSSLITISNEETSTAPHP